MQRTMLFSQWKQARTFEYMTLALIAFAAACSDGPLPPELPTPVASVEVSPDGVLLQIGGNHSLSATVRAANGQMLGGRTIQWSSSNEAVATVSPAGLVSAHALGDAIITARSEGKQGQANVTIRAASPVPEITALSPSSTPASQSNFTLTITGTGFTPDARVRLNSTPRPFTYVSDTELQVQLTSVDIGIPGTFSVTVINLPPAGGVSNAVPFTVTQPVPASVASISIYAGSLDISTGVFEVMPWERHRLTATLRSADGTVLPGRAVAWSSSDSTVVRIDPASGWAAGVQGGTVTITATSEGQVGRATLRIPDWISYGIVDYNHGQGLPLLIRTSADTTHSTATTMQVVERRVRLVSGRFDVSTRDGRYRQWFELNTTERTVTYSGGNATYGPERPVGDAQWIQDHGHATEEVDWRGFPIYRSSVFPDHRFVFTYPADQGGVQQRIPGQGTQLYYFGYRRHGAP